MNKIIEIDENGNFNCTDNDEVLNSAISNLAWNNTYVPDITKVSIQESKEQMTVWFDDGTWVIVKRSCEGAADDMGGLVYAIVKRVCGNLTDSGYVRENGFMNKLKKVLADAITEKKTEEEKKARIKENEERCKREHEEAVNRRNTHPTLGYHLRSLEEKFDALLDAISDKKNKKTGFFSR